MSGWISESVPKYEPKFDTDEIDISLIDAKYDVIEDETEIIVLNQEDLNGSTAATENLPSE
jgi:hypothetical protein